MSLRTPIHCLTAGLLAFGATPAAWSETADASVMYRCPGNDYKNTISAKEAEKLGLTGNHLYHVLLGYLYTGNDQSKAIHHLHTALNLAKTERERNLIRKDLEKM